MTNDYVQDALNQVVDLLRAFPPDAELINPVTAFKEEYELSSDKMGVLRPNSRLAKLSNEEWELEVSSADHLSEQVWCMLPTATPEEVLERVLAECDESGGPHSVVGLPESLDKLLVCKNLLRTSLGNLDREGEKVSAAEAAEINARLDELVRGATVLRNPLTELALRERDGRVYFQSSDEREAALDTLESLSRRLWHLHTTVSVEVLRVRLLLRSTQGMEDLDAMCGFAELIGLRVAISNEAPSLQVEDDSLYETLF